VTELAIIVPTRGRPENMRKVVSAWDFTNAWDVADLVMAVDQDDPAYQGYVDLLDEFNIGVTEGEPSPLRMISYPLWLPMVHKLDDTARALADEYWALGFAGDDHLPRTINWAKAYLEALHKLGTGLVYGDDGYQHANLCTEWAMTADAVRALGRMVPAPVEHMYSDVSVLEVFRAANAVSYLPQVVIEHMHPIVKKAENDAQYQRVNSRDQFRKDRLVYEGWQANGRPADVAAVAALQPERSLAVPDRPGRASRRTTAAGTGRVAETWTGRVKASNNPARSGPRTKKGPEAMTVPRSSLRLTPRYLRDVKALTPPEVGITLADMARQVPAGQAIVELGVYQGYTALMLSFGARQGNGAHVWGFDPWDSDGNVYGPEFNLRSARVWAKHNVQAHGHTKDVHLAQMFSSDAADLWDGPPIGLLYVDGDHTYQGCRTDIAAWARHLAPGATIAVDDYVAEDSDYDGLRLAVDEMVDAGTLEPLQVFHGRLAVTRLAGETLPTVVNDASKVIGRTETVETILGAPVTHQDNGTVMVENEGDGSAFERAADDHAREEDDLLEPEPEIEPEHPLSVETDPEDRLVVHEGELDGIAAGNEVAKLNLINLKALAKKRGIVLGRRKDKRSEIIAAIRDGK
jgi:predicted O-methyltransferase YrrM